MPVLSTPSSSPPVIPISISSQRPMGGHALEVLHADGNVLIFGLLGEVEHVRREQCFTMLLVVLLVCLEHAVKPRKKLLRAVVGVEDYGAKAGFRSCRRERVRWDLHAVGLGDSAHMVRTSDGTGDRGLLLVVSETLTSEVCASALGALDDDGGLDIPIESHVRREGGHGK